ncbi:MAG: hypothetical protein ACK5MY_02545 [Jhaorihella sp.]
MIAYDMFDQPTNTRPEGTDPTAEPQDLIETMLSALEVDVPEPSGMGAYIPDLPEIDPGFDMEQEPSDLDEAMGLSAMIGDDFPLAPPDEVEYLDEPTDLSSMLPSVRRLANTVEPVSLEELRQQLSAGTLNTAATDPFGQRLRQTLRQLVRGT